MSASDNPKLVIILSGKRKSGKDYVADLMSKTIKNCAIFRVSGPIKKQYAIEHGLDFSELLSSSSYKENYRKVILKWSEEIRAKDPNYFLRIAIEEANAVQFPIWLLPDARRVVDIQYFFDEFPSSQIITVRIVTDENIRIRRGWFYTDGIDNAETECGLDDWKNWSIILQNNDATDEEILQQLKPVYDSIKLIRESN